MPIDLEDRDFLPAAPPGKSRYAMLPTWCDETPEIKRLQKQVTDEIYRSESRGMFIHRKLKLHGRVGETEDDFRARCEAAAADEADKKIAGMQEKADRKVRRLEDKIARTRQRIVEQEGVIQGRKTEEMVGMGETVLSFFVGRRRSLSTAVSRRSRTQRSQQHLVGMEDQLARLEEEAMMLQEALAADIDELRAEWQDVASDGVESKAIRLVRNDISVVRFGVLWVPVTREF